MRLENFEYEIIKECGIISEIGRETLELNVIRYNNANPKYDLRKWEGGHPELKYGKLMKKGLTMDADQLYFLKETLDGMNLEEPIPDSRGFVTGGFGQGGGFDTSGKF